MKKFKEWWEWWNNLERGRKIEIIGHLTTIVPILIGYIYTGISYLINSSNQITKFFIQYSYPILIFVIVSLSFSLVRLIIANNNQLKEINQGRVGLDTFISITEYRRFNRFEQIEDKNNKIVYGHINYPPLLDYIRHNNNDIPNGIGVKLIHQIFYKSKLEDHFTSTLWNNLVDSLIQKTVDIIATPLFETNDRSKKILFCSPIFYSEVCMYVKFEGKVHQALGFNSNFKLDAAINIIKTQASTLKVICLEGEISGQMIKKRLSEIPAIIAYKQDHRTLVTKLIEKVDEGESDIVFAEKYQADMAEQVRKGSVINILASNELHYPVSFALRKEEYILKNYINFRLLELGRENIIDIIVNVLVEQKCDHPLVNYLRILQRKIGTALGIKKNEKIKAEAIQYKMKLLYKENKMDLNSIHNDAELNELELKKLIKVVKVRTHILEDVENYKKQQVDKVKEYFLPALPNELS